MARKDRDNVHDLEAIALAYWRCVCGVEWRNEKLRGKSDEDLAIETGREFEKHKAVYEKKG